jgi:hypothetical protein
MKLLIDSKGELRFVDDQGMMHKQAPRNFYITPDDVYMSNRGNILVNTKGRKYQSDEKQR